METALVGCGDIGLRVAQRLLAGGTSVLALNRSGISLSHPRLQSRSLDLDRALADGACSGRRVFYSAPPAPEGGCDTRLRRWLDAADAPEVIVYISTSGVYGDCGGAWVDETRAPQPITPRALRRLDAEQQLQAYCESHGIRLAILRAPGIYGPGRLPRARLLRGEPVVQLDQAPWSNRIHADDLAAAACLALDKGHGVYNVSDGNPSSMSDYFLRCAEFLGLPEPPQIALADAARQFSAVQLSFLRESRRLDISRIRQGLGFRPQYPNLAHGLAHCT